MFWPPVFAAPKVPDKFSVSLESAVLKGNAVEFTMKIVNQSTEPQKVDISAEVTIIKSADKNAALQVPANAVHAGIYKPQFVIVSASDKLLFSSTATARVFAPKTLAPGEAFSVTKSITVDSGSLLNALEASPCDIFACLLGRSDAGAAVQTFSQSTTSKLSKTPDNQVHLTLEPVGK